MARTLAFRKRQRIDWLVAQQQFQHGRHSRDSMLKEMQVNGSGGNFHMA
jgi:hypothetical protein